MIRLSIQARQALARLTLPVLILASFALMLLGKADALVAEKARSMLADSLAPIYRMLADPLDRARSTWNEASDLLTMRDENARLRAENEQLRRWQSVALALDAENQRLKASLNWIPDPSASYITARVVADAGGLYAKAVLLSVGPNHGIRKGQIALDDRGLVGRVTEVGARTARVLLITDLNSRIPVTLETSRARAILIGTNNLRPRLVYWPEGVTPRDGERIVTSAEANAFPANLPVGTIHYAANGVPEVEPAAQLQKLEIVRVFDYGAPGLGGSDAVAPSDFRGAETRGAETRGAGANRPAALRRITPGTH
jgi:rod shape-determining protein MreC